MTTCFHVFSHPFRTAFCATTRLFAPTADSKSAFIRSLFVLVVDLVFRCSVGERYQVPDDKKSENAVFVVETMANEGGSLRRMTFDGTARGGSMHEH
jgi:hypothetical protein